MKAILRLLPVLLLTALLVTGLSSCLMKEKVVELVLTGTTSAEYSYNDITEEYDENVVLDFTEELNQVLEDADISRDEIESAFLVGVEYGAISLTGHDWTVSGHIQIERDGTGFQDLVIYTDQSIEAALGKRLSAPLETAGVTVINDAMNDFLAGDSPVLTLKLLGGNVTPDPSAGDPIVFTWKAWLTLQLTVEQTLEVPDPF
ncbi:hypothetical protein FJ251_14040 [bacterium]|nr:hypothetical protein [bacterium]